ncbi:MAG: T9SS type A sorting domain-containing protein, partial [Chitinophagales bacterium]
NATLKYSLKNEEEISIQLLDVEGRILKTFIESEKQQAGDHQQEIIMPEGLAAGSYLLVISSTNGNSVSVKIVK